MKVYVLDENELKDLGVEKVNPCNLAVAAMTIGDVIENAYDRGEISDEEFELIPNILDEHYEDFITEHSFIKTDEVTECVVKAARLLTNIADEEM